jgi:tRNA(fMet)-specific endonuclease VapC
MGMKQLLFDTCFLIDIEREMKRGAGDAMQFLRLHAAAVPMISLITVGEFSEGFADPQSPICTSLLQRFQVVPMTQKTALRYASITRVLRKKKQLIGTNDLWIAASALEHDLFLVTKNLQDFSRIEGLKILKY